MAGNMLQLAAELILDEFGPAVHVRFDIVQCNTALALPGPGHIINHHRPPWVIRLPRIFLDFFLNFF
jgi:hypothetical protein